MSWWQMLLYPFSLLFNLITWLRNISYDMQPNRAIHFDANVIVIGNLAIGGTGKTPMVDYLIKYFHSHDQHVATLSRGYGRKSIGFRIANVRDTPDTMGDEPYMYYQKYLGQVPVAVCGQRDLAITELLGTYPQLRAILMDDAMQHRRVVPSVTIMMTTYSNPFYVDHILPSGRLREARHGARRAQIIIVTKCPEILNGADQVKFKHEIAQYSDALVFFSRIEYQELKPIFGSDLVVKKKAVCISGLANPEPFERFVKSQYEVVLTHHYRDHYRYKEEDIRDIIKELNDETMLVTTEKDMVKLRQFRQLKPFSCNYLPIEMKFLKDESLFLQTLESYLDSGI